MESTPPPNWLAELAKSVTTMMVPTEVMAPVGCHYHNAEGVWEVTIFVSRTEVVGGEQDGLRFPSRFVVDVGGVIALFSDVASLEWQALPQGMEDEIGAHLAVQGRYEDEPILLRITAEAPERFSIGRYANVYEMRFVDAW